MQASPIPFTGRILSVDQFRGYTIAGMILVNFLGGFASISEWFKHHSDWMSYADTIAPIFVFVAGMGFRLSVLRNEAKEGRVKALLSGARKYAVLFIVGAVFYGPLDWHSWTDALVDIACSGFLALPFMYSGVRVRVGMAFVYMAIYQYLFTYAGYGGYTMAAFPNGGPLAPLSWVFCFLLGTVLYDLVATRDTRKIIIGCIVWGLVLSAIGWGLRAEWPGIKEFWCFSQRAMTAPYPIYATGLAFLTYLPFYLLCDLGKLEIPTLTAVGANPLVMYMLHFFYMDAHGSIVARESSATIAVLAFCGFYLMCYIVAAYLYRNKYIVKVG